MRYFPLFIIIFLLACNSIPDSGKKYTLVQNKQGGMNDTAYYSLVNDPKGIEDDTIWKWHQKHFQFEWNENDVRQTAKVSWNLNHKGDEVITMDFDVDSAGKKYKKAVGPGMVMVFSNEPISRIVPDENGNKITVHSYALQIDAQSQIQVDFDPQMQFIIFRKLGEDMPEGIVYNKKMVRK